ncbi:MAG: VWA domain-containing protein [Halorhodospira halophila]|uniref:VWA domain-containing protein n=1 Tax=Halorhodospira TaxID=85108 RepID=UPI0019140BA2|nr:MULTISPECIES: VWA domain-containing protein [Halorhodospira]MBK5936459.1 magnesium chelatase ATPase subunit D [Halorhodospira halophila]MBK5943933.1 magnesium chelatase ATPase subunit D [Halorhodospira halophila]MCC3750963.1 VWA domain-containing protein [Halorhodospira halophila]MCG5536880.1 VWA domain-containing protein [Halorhodospira sp. 9622]
MSAALDYTNAESAWEDATCAAALLAIDPPGVGGVCLRSLPGPVRERWVQIARELLPAGTPWRRIPINISDSRLLGGLDLTATLRSGRPVVERGVLAEVDGGVAVLAMAERIAPATAGKLGAVLDNGEVRLERDGLADRMTSRFGVIALDEGAEEDERPVGPLRDRLGCHLELNGIPVHVAGGCEYTAEDVAAARERLDQVTCSDDLAEALCAGGLALGIGSLRAPLQALRAARAAAALDGRTEVSQEDVALATRLILVPRATRIPEMQQPEQEQPEEQQEPEQQEAEQQEQEEPPPPPEQETDEERPEDDGGEQDQPEEGPDEEDDEEQAPAEIPAEVVLDAARAVLPDNLLQQMKIRELAQRNRSQTPGRAGALQQGGGRGRPAGVRPGSPGGGARLNVVETLRTAAPWQPLRRQHDQTGRRVIVRPEDFRITRFKQRSQTTTIFAVDASGSSAMHRLSEAKGAVELLLAECYVRRDEVALVAFRGRGAEVLLPPTRSLTRAKKGLAGLPGGGGTPLAAGIDTARQLTDEVRRKGATPVLILLTDGRANVTREGVGGREKAQQEATESARAIRVMGIRALVVDTSPRPRPMGRELAEAMGAEYLPLPRADASSISSAVQAVTGTGR